MKSVRWGIVGLGNIANKFAGDLALIPNCSLQAVASSDSARANEFAHKYKAKNSYSNYTDLFCDPAVDLVYIASLHPSHAALSIEAIKYGKGVLCEKPMGMNAKQVKQIIQAATEANVFLMEALWTRFNPAFEQIHQWILENKIGNLRYINATFSFNGLNRGVDSRLFNPEKGGGSLLDIGIYPLFLGYHFLGIPETIKASAVLTKEGVDEQLGFIFSYPKAQAIMYSSFAHDEDMQARICGELGEIYMNSRWHETGEIKLVLNGKEYSKSLPINGKGYTYEIIEANSCFLNGKTQSSKWKWQQSLDIAILMDAIRKQTNIVYPADN